KTCQNGQLDTISEFERNSWIHLSDPTREEIERVSLATNISASTLKVALDPEEFAHIDIEDGVYMVVLDIPIIEKENEVYVFSTVPIGLIYNKDFFVSVCLKETSIIKDLWANRVKGIETRKQVRLLLQIVQRTEFKYLQYLKRIDKTSNVVQQRLHQSVKNNELIDLLDIEKSLVYFSTSLSGNDRVLYKIQRTDDFKKYEEDVDLLDDVINDNKQAIEMCNIYRDILSGTMDAFASVISNNLNIIMKTLTILTLIMTIPQIISSLWGMNVNVPFENNPFGFWIVLGGCVVVSLVGGLVLKKLSNSTDKGRRLRRRPKKKN
ncbi:MAG: magnesium transporter CorA family protein, partial [Clostridia bacterium]